MGTFCIVQGAQLVLCDDLEGLDGGEGRLRGKGYLCTQSGFTSLYSRN